MNEKNKEKRASATIKKTAHRRLKIMAAKEGAKINDIVDEAIFYFLKNIPEVRK